MLLLLLAMLLPPLPRAATLPFTQLASRSERELVPTPSAPTPCLHTHISLGQYQVVLLRLSSLMGSYQAVL